LNPRIIQFYRGKIDEQWARACQIKERRDFLYCGKTPRQGQRIETVVDLEKQSNDTEEDTLSRAQIRLSGIVTHVGVLPTFSDWIIGDNFANRLPSCGNCNLRPLHQPYEKISYVFPASCINPACYTNRADIENPSNYLGIMMQRSLLMHGSLHNQIVVSYNYLSPESAQLLETRKDDSFFALQTGRVYKMTLLAQDTIPVFYWKVVSIEDVTDTERFEELPEAFRDFVFTRKSVRDLSPFEYNVDHDGDDDELMKFLLDLHEERMDNSVEER
jgi:hypothetical protein